MTKTLLSPHGPGPVFGTEYFITECLDGHEVEFSHLEYTFYVEDRKDGIPCPHQTFRIDPLGYTPCPHRVFPEPPPARRAVPQAIVAAFYTLVLERAESR